MTRTRLVRTIGACFLAVLAASAAACDNGSSTSPTTPTTPGITETFTGTVQVGGADVKIFTTAAAGEIDVTLTAVGPPPTITVGLGLGTPSADQQSCSISAISSGSLAVQTPAGTSPQLTPVTAPAGTYCVTVVDVGNAATTLTYSVTVIHH